MSPEEQQEVAKALGLNKVPKLRYDDIPKETEISPRELITFRKMLECVDALDTAAFERYIPDEFTVDQSIDTRTYKRGWTFPVYHPLDIPVPSNRKIMAATGIPIGVLGPASVFPLMANHLRWISEELGTRRIGPPLVFRTDVAEGRSHPMLGVIVKFDRTPPDGKTMEDMMADVGVLHPKEDLDVKQVVEDVVLKT